MITEVYPGESTNNESMYAVKDLDSKQRNVEICPKSSAQINKKVN